MAQSTNWPASSQDTEKGTKVNEPYPIVQPPENPVLAKLVAAGAVNAIALTGYIGPPITGGRITLYPSLADLSSSVEIASSDILHFEPVPETILPYGGVIVWVKKEAEIARRHVENVSALPTSNLVEVRAGRLRIFKRVQEPPPPAPQPPCSGGNLGKCGCGHGDDIAR
jgi:hypothetical protein